MVEMERDDEPLKPKSTGLLWVGFALLGSLAAVELMQQGLYHMPWSWEVALGQLLAPAVGNAAACQGPPEAMAALEKLVTRIYPVAPEDSRYSIHVTVVPVPQSNAVAWLGGAIWLFEGLVQQAESSEEIAAVLAHEIGHVHKRHGLQRLLLYSMERALFALAGNDSALTLLEGLASLDFSRGQEEEADEAALLRLKQARVSLDGWRRFFQRLESSEEILGFLSTHPMSAARRQRAELVGPYPHEPILTEEEWHALQTICKPPKQP